MPKIDCSCRGISPDCPRCFGKGEYNPNELEKSRKNRIKNISNYQTIHAERNEKNATSVKDDDRTNEKFLEKFTNEKKILLIDKIVNMIDALSEQQRQILSSSKRSTAKISESTMRRLAEIESKKSEWKLKLKIIQESVTDGKKIVVMYRHFLSKKWQDYYNLSETMKLRKGAISKNKAINRDRKQEETRLKIQKKSNAKGTVLPIKESKNSNPPKFPEVKKTRKERYKEGKKFRPSNGNSLGDFYERDKWKREKK
jgi:hypothetical protein